MKLIRNCANKLVAGSVALFVLAWAAELSAAPGKQGSGQGTATVTAFKGQARYSMDNGKSWRPIKAGLVLKAPAVIQTAANSHVDMVLGERDVVTREPSALGELTSSAGSGGGEENANIVRISPDSILAIDKLTVEETGADVVSEVQLDLRAGQIMGNVKKLSAASRYEVKFPTGVAGIRGTIYTLNHSGVVNVFLGSVVISYLKDGVAVTKVVMAGQRFDPATGLVTPIPPVDIDSLKDFRRIFGRIHFRPIHYTFDHTIYYVSPLTGHFAGGGGGGGGGQ
jgi:hypothetical protein